jgi:Tol biopolymer transport system component
MVRIGGDWGAPVLLTGGSPYSYNDQPAISTDGSRVVFNCSDVPYGQEGTAICEVSTEGTGFRVVLTPAQGPGGTPQDAVRHPDYGPDGSIIFEGDWNGTEQIWRMPPGATEPIRVSPQFSNDNSPCVLPDGRIASLWLNRPGGQDFHEIKVMATDGSSYVMALASVDVADVGIGCGE